MKSRRPTESHDWPSLLESFNPVAAPAVADRERLKRLLARNPAARAAHRRLVRLSKKQGLSAPYDWREVIAYAVVGGWGFAFAANGHRTRAIPKSEGDGKALRKKAAYQLNHTISLVNKIPEAAVGDKVAILRHLEAARHNFNTLLDRFEARSNSRRAAKRPLQMDPEARMIVLLSLYFKSKTSDAKTPWDDIGTIVGAALNANGAFTGNRVRQTAKRWYPRLKSRQDAFALLYGIQ